MQWPWVLALAVVGSIMTRPAAAQGAAPAPQAAAIAAPETLKAREDELEATRAQQKSAAEAEAKL